MTSTFQVTGAGSTGPRIPTTNWYLVMIILLASVVGALLASGLLFLLIRKTIKKDVQGLRVQPVPIIESVPTSRPASTAPPVTADKPANRPMTEEKVATTSTKPDTAPDLTGDRVDKNTQSNQPEGPGNEDEQTPD